MTLMLALRYVYVLALVVWLGGMVVLGAIVAPTTFQVLQASAPVIGPRARRASCSAQILARFHYVAYARGRHAARHAGGDGGCSARARAAFAVRAARSSRRCWRSRCTPASSCSSTIDAIQREVGGLPSRLPADDARRVRFDELHQLSTRLMMVNIAGALVLLYWEAREHGQ